jgi:hypothetical protein
MQVSVVVSSVKHVKFTGQTWKIQQELNYVQGKKSKGVIRRYVEVEGDSNEVLACYRRIQGHLQRLSVSFVSCRVEGAVLMITKVNANLSIWKTVDEIATVRFIMGSAILI